MLAKEETLLGKTKGISAYARTGVSGAGSEALKDT
jgi:hypothetical protein